MDLFKREKSELRELAQKIIHEMTKMKKTLVLAESCTGGLSAHTLTNVKGCSKVLLFSAVTYSAQSKHLILDVPWEIINEFGTVSSETAMHLLRGLKKKVDSDIQFVYTGVTDVVLEGKEAGTVILGIKTPLEEEIIEHKFAGNREQIKKQAVLKSYQIILEKLQTLE